jgi:hypothetical protein
MTNQQPANDLDSPLWHIASALKGIELKLENLNTAAEALLGLKIGLDHFSEPFQKNSQFSRLVELIEKQTQLLEEQHHMSRYRK